MNKLSFGIIYLHLQLLIIEFKTFVLAQKSRYLLLKQDGLLFDRRMLLVKQRNALTQYRCRAVLVNQLFDAVKKAHR